jgi:signal transduction histidine kinase
MNPSGSGTPEGDATRPEPRGLPLTHNLRLGDRFTIHALVRAGLALAIIVGAVVGRTIVGIEDLDVTALFVLGLVMLAYDFLAFRRMRPYLAREAVSRNPRRLVRTLYLLIVLDYLVLVAAIWFVGGVRSPFLPFFLLHVILSCLLLSRRAALAFHWMAYGFLTLLVVGEWSGVTPAPRMPTGAVGGTAPLDGRYAITVLVVYGMLFAVTAYLLLGLAATLRQSERQLRAANAELSRLSLMRRDFLRIALHNLQSPIGVVRMFLSNLRAGLGGPVTEQQTEWIDRSMHRLEGVKAFMHDLQMLASLESGQLEARTSTVDLRALLRDLVAENADLAEQAHHALRLDAPDDLPRVRGVDFLLREALANYLSNAVKYTPSGGNILVTASSRSPMVRIEVKDDGVGIAPEDQDRLFGEFVRLGPRDETMPPAEGSGLGLTIVKRVAELHGGRCGLRSRPGEGSTFFLELPADVSRASAPPEAG